MALSCLAEKGGSRTLRGPYDPQTGFEDQRHHRAPSFSVNVFNYLWRATLFCLPIRLPICEVPKALATSPHGGLRIVDASGRCCGRSLSSPRLRGIPCLAHSVRAVFLNLWNTNFLAPVCLRAFST